MSEKNNAEDDHMVILGIILIWIIIVKNKSEPISIYEIVRICYVWWPVGESNSRYRRERAVS